MKGKRILSFAMALVLAGTSISGISETAVAKKSPVTVTKKVSLKAGKKGSIAVTHAKKVKIQKTKFKSLNVKIVQVNKKGVLTGLSAGRASVRTTVTYKYKKKKVKRNFTTKVIVTKGGDVKLPVTDNDTSAVPYPSNAPVSAAPTKSPSVTKSAAPTESPTVTESAAPTESPTVTESAAPTKSPSVTESAAPTESPTVTESAAPTKSPSVTESAAPTKSPSVTESAAPTKSPSVTESAAPTESPTVTEDPQETKNPLEEPPLVSAEPTQCPDGQHQMETVEMKEPTCATQKDGQPLSEKDRRGYVRRKCTICGYEMETVLEPAQHTFKIVITEATCKLPAREHRICEVCGEEDGSGTNVAGSKALGHSYEWQVTKAATCTHAGIETHKCVRCEEVQKDAVTGQTVKEIPKTGHKVLHEICAYCHERFHSFDLDENGCELVDNRGWVVTGTSITIGGSVSTGAAFVIPEDREATCTEDGCQYRLCKDCGRLECLMIKAHGHTAAAEPYVTEATCTASGTSVTVCSRCKQMMKVDEIPPKGHSYKWVTTKEATCEEEGIEKYQCEVCGHAAEDPVEKKSEKAVPAKGHDMVTVDEIKATCTAGGYDLVKCRREGCEWKSQINKTPPNGHNTSKGKWVTTKEATCEEEGIEKYQCGDCGQLLEKDAGVPENYWPRAVKAEGHEWVDQEPVKATCEDGGYTPQTCRKCHKTDHHKEGSDIPALGHNYVEVSAYSTPATCTENGNRYMECSRCKKHDASTDKPIPALGHTTIGGSWTTVKEATCTENGLKNYKCGRCDHYFTADDNVADEYKPKEIAAKDHDWVKDTLNCHDRTCTTDEVIAKKCTRCEATETEVGQKHLGHDWKNEKKMDNTGNYLNMVHAKDCQHYAGYYQVCANCGEFNTEYIWEDIDDGKLEHSGGMYGYHQNGMCYKTCTGKLYDGTTCGQHYAGVKITSKNGGTENCHAKCANCGLTISTSHSFNYSTDIMAYVATEAHATVNGKKSKWACMATVIMNKAAGKKMHLEKLTLNVTSGKTVRVAFCSSANGLSNPLDTPIKVTGDSKGKAEIVNPYFTVPSDGKFYINVFDMDESTSVGFDDEFSFFDAACDCGYSFINRNNISVKAGAQ